MCAAPSEIRADDVATVAQQYALAMNWLRGFFARLKGGPPTGPLTTREQTDADELRDATLANENAQVAREQKAKDGGSDGG